MSSPPPKRPKNKGHRSSFFERLHQRHDAKHHAGENRHYRDIEQAPLLREEHPDSDPETQSVQDQPSHLQSLNAIIGDVTTTSNEQIVNRAGVLGATVRNKALKTMGGIKVTILKAMMAVERNIKSILAILCAILAFICIAEAVSIHQHRSPIKPNVCTTTACVYAASGILQNLHPLYQQIDPCDSFDKYVCGGFDAHHELREDQADLSTGNIVAEEVQSVLRGILEQGIGNVKDADKEVFTKVKDAYTACMDESKLQEFGIKPLKSIADEIKVFFSGAHATSQTAGGLQLTSEKSAANSGSLTTVYIRLMKMGISAFINLEIGTDDKNPEIQTIFASPVRTIGLPMKELYKNKKIVTDYRKTITQTLQHFYDTTGNASVMMQRLSGMRFSVDDLTQGILNLETKIASILPNSEVLDDITTAYNKMTYGDFHKLFPQLSLRDIVQELVPGTSADSTLIVSSPDYVVNLSTIIDSTPKQVIQGFLVWKAVQEYASEVEDNAVENLKQFSNHIVGKNPMAKDDRWRICVASIDEDLGWILSKFYVQDQFSQQANEFSREVLGNVRQSFDQLLAQANWMTDKDRAQARSKAEAMSQKVGYPSKHPDILDPSSLKDYYNAVLVRNDTYLRNKLSATRGKLVRRWSKLGEPTDRNKWHMTATTVNAYYDPSANEIVFPAAILRSPIFYDLSVPRYLSYGAFGAVGGHEISHAFDNHGAQYNEKGVYTDWWSNSTRKAFEAKTACFVDQYSHYAVDGPDGKMHVNGNLTLGENIADAGGTHAAYQAWANLELNEASQSLPGLEHFSKQQLFWLSYGNQWCSRTTKEAAMQKVLRDPHAPKPVRIKGTVANSREFREAFDCPTKTPTCELW